jgi:hypothetical protein
VVDRLGLERSRADALLASAKAKLKIARDARTPPGRDDKVLTSWNALAIKGLVRAALVCREPGWVDVATQAVDFIASQLCDESTLYATWCRGRRGHGAWLDDYANLLDALLVLLRARWRDRDVALARRLADVTLDRFRDPADGGFFFTPSDHEKLIHRVKPTVDEATPSGNGVLARALHTLGHLLGESRYVDAAQACVRWARGAMERYPAGHCALLAALEEVVYPPELVIVRGPADAIAPWLELARKGHRPWRHVFGIPYDGVREVPGYLPRLVSADARGRPTAYVCTNSSCSLPICDLDGLKATLGT